MVNCKAYWYWKFNQVLGCANLNIVAKGSFSYTTRIFALKESLCIETGESRSDSGLDERQNRLAV